MKNLKIIDSTPFRFNVKFVEYSDKSFAIVGETKEIKDSLKEMGGKFNSFLKCGKGWIFSNKRKETVLSFLK